MGVCFMSAFSLIFYFIYEQLCTNTKKTEKNERLKPPEISVQQPGSGSQDSNATESLRNLKISSHTQSFTTSRLNSPRRTPRIPFSSSHRITNSSSRAKDESTVFTRKGFLGTGNSYADSPPPSSDGLTP